MQRLVFTWQRLTILPAHLPLLHTPLAADDDLGAGVLLHVLEGVSSGSNEQSNKVDVRMTVLGDHHLVTHLHHRSLVVWRRLVVSVDEHHLLDAVVPHLLQLLPLPVLPRVQPLPVRGVDGFRRWRPILGVQRYAKVSASQSSARFLYFQLH